MRRIRVVTARRGEDGEQESLKTKDGELESLETKDGEQESLETKERIMREVRLDGQSKTGTQACHKHHGNQRDGSSGQNIGWKLCGKDLWVEQESRSLDPEWRNSAGHAQNGNSGSRRPYIRPQSAGAGVVLDHEESNHQDQLNYQSEQSVNQVIYEEATTRRVVGSSAVGSIQGTRSPRRDVRD